MDYINYVKQYPLQGMTGMWGGVGSNLVAGGAATLEPWGTRGVIMGGYTIPGGDNFDNIQYVTIGTTGNSTNFGALTGATRSVGATSNNTRALAFGGRNNSPTQSQNVIQYVTIAGGGSGATDFGDLTLGTGYSAACSDGTKACNGGGTAAPGATAEIDVVTIDTTGNAAAHGDLQSVQDYLASYSSGTIGRGVWAGGRQFPAGQQISYKTIASSASTSDFGDLTLIGRGALGGCSDGTRGVNWAGWGPSTSDQNVIDYITIASTGNATDFGDFTKVTDYAPGATSSETRGIQAGNQQDTTEIAYVTIQSTGNATDFGNLNVGGAFTGCTAGNT